MRFIAALVAVPLLSATAGGALAGTYGEESFFYEQQPEARGCYYYRGREFCGRYCYIEVNGQRYCRTRRREAFPQAGAERMAAPPRRPYQYPVRGGWFPK